MHGFTVINNDVFKDTNLNMQERYFLIVLKTFDHKNNGQVFPTYETLMKYCGISKRSIIAKLVKSLEDKNYITIGKRGRLNTYKFIKDYLVENKKLGQKDILNKSAKDANEKGTSSHEGTGRVDNSSHVGTDRISNSSHAGTGRVNNSSHVGTDRISNSSHEGTDRVNSSSHAGTDRINNSSHGGTDRVNNSSHAGTGRTNNSSHAGTDGINNSSHAGTGRINNSSYAGTDRVDNSSHAGTDRANNSSHEGTDRINNSSHEGTDRANNSSHAGTHNSSHGGTSTSSHVGTLKIKEKNTKEKYIIIFNTWNNINIYREACLDKKIENSITIALNKYTLKEILEAIKNYKEIYESDFYYDYIWSLSSFLARPNALPKFKSDGEIWRKYKAIQSKKEKFDLTEFID